MTGIVDPERRRVVVVLAAGERRDILRDPDRVDLLEDAQTTFVAFPPEPTDDAALVELLRTQDLLRPGTVAVQNPYATERYAGAGEAVSQFAVEKVLITVRLARLLGATKVSLVDSRADEKHTSMTARVGVKAPAGTLDASVREQVANEVQQRLQAEYDFEGGPPAVEEARLLLASSRLAGDAELVALVDLRDGPNPIRRQRVQISGSREASRNIEVAVRLAGGRGKVKLAGVTIETEKSWKHHVQVDVTTEITF